MIFKYVDLRTMGIKRWRLTAKNRMEWVGIVREARSLQGPYSQRLAVHNMDQNTTFYHKNFGPLRVIPIYLKCQNTF
jgi:hypothetical protein